MHRSLPNIIFIVILFILATAFPLSTEILSLNLSQKIVDKPTEVLPLTSSYLLIAPEEVDSISKTALSFVMESDTGLFDDSYTEGILVERYNGDQLIDSLSIDALDLTVTDEGTKSKRITIEKSALTADLTTGYYRFKIISEDGQMDYVWYAALLPNDVKLLATTSTVPAGSVAMTLYFPNAAYDDVVPMTRFTPLPTNRWRALYTALQNGPKTGYGLYETAPVIPYAPNIKLGSNRANIYMYSSNLKGFEGKFPIIREAITKTFMSYDPLNGVSFYVDDSQNRLVDGVDLKSIYTENAVNSVFLNQLAANGTLLLTPEALKATTLEERVTEAWNLLKAPNAKGIQPLPEEVELIGHSVEGKTLNLDVKEGFTTLFSSQPEYRNLMMKSLLYTFTSFPEIETILMYEAGKLVIIEGFDFSKPLQPDRYFNIEP